MPRTISFSTVDGVRIVGKFSPVAAAGPAALLLHMMPATKESWDDLATRLVRGGLSVLAIDLRGHGESIEGPGGKRLDYKLFSDAEHRDKMRDVEAAVAWLGGRGRDPSRLVIAGASIGANLAIAYVAAHPETPAAAALSPGLDYRGITTPDKVRRMKPEQGLFLAASEEDELSFTADRELAGLKPGAVLKEYRGAGHGTSMLGRAAGLEEELAEWLIARTRPSANPAVS